MFNGEQSVIFLLASIATVFTFCPIKSVWGILLRVLEYSVIVFEKIKALVSRLALALVKAAILFYFEDPYLNSAFKGPEFLKLCHVPRKTNCRYT